MRFSLLVGMTFSLALPRAYAFEPMAVNIFQLKNFSQADHDKLRGAAFLLSRIVNSEAFRQRILQFSVNGVERFHMNQGLTNEQILERINAGRESYSQTDDHSIDLALTLYRKWWRPWSVVGYTNPGKPEIFLNRNYFNVFQLNQIAGNLMHEWCHKIGFEHEYRSTRLRPFSVPYAVGQIVVDLGTTKSSFRR